MAYEKVLLYGIPIVASRRIGYGRVDPVVARELFIRHALVEGDWRTHHAFFRANRETLAEIARLEDRTRRRDLVVDDETLFDLYDARVGRGVVSVRHFDSWWKKTRKASPGLLSFGPEMLTAKDVDGGGFPDSWQQGELAFDLSYVFAPGQEDDGVTARIPITMLNQVRPEDFSWLIPGWREDLVIALLRSLPKVLRRYFVPAPDFARKLVAAVAPDTQSFYSALSREMWRMSGIEVRPDDFDVERLPAHLRMRFEIVAADGHSLASGRSLEQLAKELTTTLRAAISDVANGVEFDGVRTWSFGELSSSIEYVRAGLRVVGFPALVDQGDAVGVRVLESAGEAAEISRRGLRRLLLLNVVSPARALQRRLPNQTKLALSRNAPGNVTELLDDCLAAAIDAIVVNGGGLPRDAAAFERLLQKVRAELPATLAGVVTTVVDVLATAHDVEKTLQASVTADALPALVDMKTQLAALVHPGFVADAGVRRLADLRRYLTAMSRRLEKLGADATRDRARMWEVQQAQQALDDARRHGANDSVALDDVRWMIEELRVSFFAQTLGTAHPVSLQRILRALEKA